LAFSRPTLQQGRNDLLGAPEQSKKILPVGKVKMHFKILPTNALPMK
jgi:hypothetical protein